MLGSGTDNGLYTKKKTDEIVKEHGEVRMYS